MMKGKWIFRGFMLFVAFVAFVFLAGYATMLLWNWLVPALFSGPVITYWQAFGLLLLSKLLFGGFGRGHRGGWHRHRWGRHWREQWEKMTPEQREEMRKRWEGRCYGRWDFPKEDQATTA